MKKLLSSLMLTLCVMFAWADSPLTSTEWWQAYQDNPVVQDALENGYDTNVMNFLCDDNNSLESRLAVVNCIGWKLSGQSNYTTCLTYYAQKYNAGSVEEAILEQMSPETRVLFAYILALDDYFDVKRARSIALSAYVYKPYSRAISMIYGLIDAQVKFDDNWCKVYDTVARFADDTRLDRDMSDYTVEQIMAYINLYKCEK